MKPRDEWGPADELAHDINLGLTFFGIVALLCLGFVGFAWLISFIWPEPTFYKTLLIYIGTLAVIGVVIGIACYQSTGISGENDE